MPQLYGGLLHAVLTLLLLIPALFFWHLFAYSHADQAIGQAMLFIV